MSDLMVSFRDTVDETIRRFILSEVGDDYPELTGMLFYHLGYQWEELPSGRSGKRLRPILVFLASEACGLPWQTALPAAAAVELLHNFSLIHDDIEDNSAQRHGRETVWKRWGMPQAINAGDLMFSLSFRALSRLNDAAVALRAKELLEQTCVLLTSGQYLDMKFESQNQVEEETYRQMVRGKTAALFICSLQLGGICAGANDDQLSSLYTLGAHLGMAFQFQDDLLGIWGDEAATGKSASSDIRSRKQTLPIIHGLQRDEGLRALWFGGQDLAEAESFWIREKLSELGSKGYTIQQMRAEHGAALSALDAADFPQGKTHLQQLINQLMDRRA